MIADDYYYLIGNAPGPKERHLIVRSVSISVYTRTSVTLIKQTFGIEFYWRTWYELPGNLITRKGKVILG